MANGNNIGLRITLGGTSEVINDIKQLEAALSKARQELKNLTIGSDDFKKLSNEIKNADSQLKNLNEKAQGIKFDKKLQQFTQLGSTITASFAAAQAAIGLFGGESEKVAEAAAKAQNLLTIALVARELATAGTTLKTIANTVATVAQTAATTAATAATRALWLALAANPLTAILAVIGLVVTALVALTGSTEDATKAEEDYQAALKKGNDERQFELQLLQAQGTSEEDLARKRLKNAKEAEEIAKSAFQRAQTKNRFDETTNKRREEADEATRQRILAQESLDTLLDENKKKRAEELSNQSKKLAEAEKQRLLDLIRLRGDLRKLELESITRGPAVTALTFPETETERQEQALKKIVAFQTDYNDAVEKFNQLTRKVERDGPGFLYVDIPQDITNQTKLLQSLISQTFELVNLPANETANKLRTLLTTQEGFLSGVNNNTEGYVKNQKELLKFEREFVSAFVSEQIKGFKGTTEETQLQRQILTEQSKIVFDNLIKNAQELNKVRSTIDGYLERIKKIADSNDRLAQSTEVVNGFIRENTKLLVESFTLPIKSIEETKVKIAELQTQITTQRFDDTRKFASDVAQLEKTLLDQGIDISKASYEEKLKLLSEFLLKEVNITENAEKKKQDAFQKTINKYISSIQAVSSVLNSLAQLTSDYYATQLEKLEIKSEKEKAKIEGDTKQANDKRLEAEKIYQEDRKRLEKEAATAALRISLAQAIANTAEAITKIFAQTGVVGIVAGTAIAGINALQIGIISSQLSALSSFQRGGYIKGQGGLIFGPSHENGGVKYQGGGVELEGGEAVINRFSAVQYRGLLDQINQAGGGRPLMSTNFDDSRILEALAKQRQTPIKTYVLESDVTNAQSINRRLELLSQI